MMQWQTRIQAIPAYIRIPLIMPSMLLPLYWWYTYSGLYRYLAEIQLQQSGEYEETLTGLLCVLALLLPAAGVMALLLRYSRWGEAGGASVGRAQQLSVWMQEHSTLSTAMLLAPIFLGLGGYSLIKGTLAGPLTQVSIAALEHGQPPPSAYVNIEGNLLVPQMVGVSETRSGSTVTKVYIPVVSPGWEPDAEVVVLLYTNEKLLDKYAADLLSGHYIGVLSANDLPGLAREELGKMGVKLASTYWVLDYRETPENILQFGWVFGLSGLVVGLLTAVVFFLQRRKNT